MNYKDTLNLPSTDFPMKANLPNREPEILRHWDSIKLYEEIRKKSKGSLLFNLILLLLCIKVLLMFFQEEFPKLDIPYLHFRELRVFDLLQDNLCIH